MKNKNERIKESSITMIGESINEAVNRIIALVREREQTIKMKFNGIESTVIKDSTTEDIVRDFQAKTAEAEKLISSCLKENMWLVRTKKEKKRCNGSMTF